MFSVSYGIRSTFKSLNGPERVLPTKTTLYPRIRVIPLTQLTDGNTADNCSHLLCTKGDEPLYLSADQSMFSNSVESIDNQESNIEQINEQNLCNEYFETQLPTENNEQINVSPSAENINQNKTDYFVDENESLVTNEVYETKVTVSKHFSNSKLMKKVSTNQQKTKTKKNCNPIIKIEVDEPFIKYESMYDKVKARSNRNSQIPNKIKVKKELNDYYSFRPRK